MSRGQDSGSIPRDEESTGQREHPHTVTERTEHHKERNGTKFRAKEGGACAQGLQILSKSTARPRRLLGRSSSAREQLLFQEIQSAGGFSNH